MLIIEQQKIYYQTQTHKIWNKNLPLWVVSPPFSSLAHAFGFDDDINVQLLETKAALLLRKMFSQANKIQQQDEFRGKYWKIPDTRNLINSTYRWLEQVERENLVQRDHLLERKLVQKKPPVVERKVTTMENKNMMRQVHTKPENNH